MKKIRIISFGNAAEKIISYIKNKGILGSAYIAADQDSELLLQKLTENDVVFVIANLGGSCSGQLTKFAAKQLPNIVCCYCLMPFQFEGINKNQKAVDDYHMLMSLKVNTVKINYNDVLSETFNRLGGSTTIGQMYESISDYIYKDILKRTEILQIQPKHL